MRERAGFVERHHLHAVRHFQRLGVFDEDAMTGCGTGARHDGGGRGQAQRTGAGDDQHGHRADQCHFATQARPPPTQAGQQGDEQHGGHEHRRDAIDHALDGRLDGLRLDHTADDVRQHGLATDGGDAHQQARLGVDGAACERGARGLAHGQGLASQQGFVHVAAAFDHDTIGGDALTGAHDQEVIDQHLLEGHLDLALWALAVHGVGSQGLEGADGGGGLTLGARLQGLAQQHQGDDDRGRLEIQLGGAVGGMRIGALAVAPPQPHRQAPGGRGAQGHQLVHIACARLEGRPARFVEARAQQELNRRGQGELHPGRPEVVASPQHGQHQGHAGHGAEQHRPPDVPPGHDLFHHGVISVLDLGVIAGALDGSEQGVRLGRGVRFVWRHSPVDGGHFGGEVDLGLGDARHLLEGPLDPAHAGGAGHAAHGQLHRVVNVSVCH